MYLKILEKLSIEEKLVLRFMFFTAFCFGAVGGLVIGTYFGGFAPYVIICIWALGAGLLGLLFIVRDYYAGSN